jgi:hypothetical protein
MRLSGEAPSHPSVLHPPHAERLTLRDSHLHCAEVCLSWRLFLKEAPGWADSGFRSSFPLFNLNTKPSCRSLFQGLRENKYLLVALANDLTIHTLGCSYFRNALVLLASLNLSLNPALLPLLYQAIQSLYSSLWIFFIPPNVQCDSHIIFLN